MTVTAPTDWPMPALGLERVLLTCAEDDLASTRTIEPQDGAMEEMRQGRRRYRIDIAGR